MFLLLLAHAFAADAPAVDLYANVGPPLGWDDRPPAVASGALGQIPYAMATEVALAQYRISAGNAQVLSAESVGSPQASPHMRIQRVSLGDGSVEDLADASSRRVCTHTAASRWQGPGVIRTFAATGPAAEDEGATTLVMVVGHPEAGTLVPLGPGDTVEVREVRRLGALVRQIVTVRHHDTALVVERQELRQRVCFSTGA